MSDILVIIPLHKFDDEVKPLLNDAVNSVPADIDIVVSASNAIVKDVTEALKDKKNVKVSGNDATDFPTLVNSAVNDDYNLEDFQLEMKYHNFDENGERIKPYRIFRGELKQKGII